MGDNARTTQILGAVAAAAIIAAGLIFGFQTGEKAESAAVFGGPMVLNRGNGAEPDSLDPHKASGQWENNVIGDMLMGLMTDDPLADPIPGAAESYTVSDDGLIYTFRIRDHKWSDGVPVTAHDFVYAMRRILDPRTAAQYASLIFPIKNAEEVNNLSMPPESLGVRAIDDGTLEITFKHPVPYLPQLLTHYTTFPVPKHVVEKHGDDWVKPENIVTNGAYVLKEWRPNDHITLVKNPHFYDAENVRVDVVNFYPTQDAAAALKRFRAGELDMNTNGVPSQQIDWLKENMPDEFIITPFILTQYVVFNTQRKPFDDVRVRMALSMAVDRETIVERVMRAGEQPAYALVPPGITGYSGKPQAPFKGRPMDERIAEAKRLLMEAGFGPDNPLRFNYNFQNRLETRLVAVALADMWKKIGATANLIPSETQVHYNLLRRQDFEVAWAGWIADYKDAKNYLYLAQWSSGEMNYGKYNNPEFDALVDQSDRERDPVRRGEILEAAETVLLRDQPLMPIYFGVSRNLLSAKVRGWEDNNLNIHRTRFMWVERETTS